MTRNRNRTPPLDSPSKQLILDLCSSMEQVRLFDKELRMVHAYERKSFHDNLDRLDRELEAVHTAALDEAAAFHDRVQEEAEATLQEHARAEEEERRIKEEAARKERERIEREKAEKLRREQEEAARLEAERKAKEEQRKKAEEEAERARRAAQEKKEQEERQKREKEEAIKLAKREEAQKALNAAADQARAERKRRTGGGYVSAKELEIHDKYLALHQNLKSFRTWMTSLAKQNPATKQAMGDLRRSIKKSVGQLRDGKGANNQQIKQIRSDLEGALKITEPAIDIRQFIVNPPAEIANSEHKVPAMLIYGLNMLSKSLISALINEAAINPEHAEPIGVLAAQTFSFDAFVYEGVHLSDILLAKYRFICPALWGFTGDEKTESGRRALGWGRVEPGGDFISEQAHYDRVAALGSGFAALTLRNFSKSPRSNPFPNSMYWVCIQKLLSIPPAEFQDTQVVILHAILRFSGERVLEFFGQFGLALLRKAIVELPRALDRNTMPVHQLKLLKETYYRGKRILL